MVDSQLNVDFRIFCKATFRSFAKLDVAVTRARLASAYGIYPLTLCSLSVSLLSLLLLCNIYIRILPLRSLIGIMDLLLVKEQTGFSNAINTQVAVSKSFLPIQFHVITAVKTQIYKKLSSNERFRQFIIQKGLQYRTRGLTNDGPCTDYEKHRSSRLLSKILLE